MQPLTVESLVDEAGLDLGAGRKAAAAPVRWVHISELRDPTPWLSGGEVLLTTGIQLDTAAKQREFVELLSSHGLAGLGFGTGFDHATIPKAVLEEARKRHFPVFEVPYRMPFIAITEKAATRVVNEGFEVLRRATAIHKELERIVLEERGMDEVVRALARAVGTAVLVLDSHGGVIAPAALPDSASGEVLEAVRAEVGSRAPNGRQTGPANGGAPLASKRSRFDGEVIALPVPTGGHAAVQAWLAAARESGPLSDFERMLLQQAVPLVALELMRQRIVRDTERRLAGDVLAEALTGRLESEEVESRMRPFGVRSPAAVIAFAVEHPAEGERLLARFLADAGVGALVATREELLCAVVDADGVDLVDLAGRARTRLAADLGKVRAAVSRSARLSTLRRSFHEARCALEASALADGDAPEVASHRDLGAFELLLSLQDDEALRLYCDSLLAPLQDGDGRYGDELIASVESFLEHNGHWERAARDLYCHRHTLRYRIRRVEELTGRDLGRARDRIEFWLALRGRELLR